MIDLSQIRKLKKIKDYCEQENEDLIFEEVSWKPIPNSPQSLAYYSTATELGFGGSPGGSKTSLLIGLALTGHFRNSVILRREYPQLQDIIAKIQEQVPSYGGGRLLRLRGKDINRTIELASVQLEKDKWKQRGRERAFIGFDEVSTFSKSQYEVITAWNRSPYTDEQCRVVATMNPPESEEGLWIVDHWKPWLDTDKYPNPAMSGEIRYFVRIKGELIETEDQTPVDVGKGKMVTPKSKTFIFSSVEDNPYLMATGYDETLASLPEELQFLNNSMNFLGNVESDPYQVIPRAWVELANERWRASDGRKKPMTALAADPARGGGDRFGIATRRDDYVEIYSKPGKDIDSGQKGGKYVLSIRQNEAFVLVDVIGVGSSTFDYLQEQSIRPLVPMVASKKSTDRTRCRRFGFANARAAWWWKLREALDPDYDPTLCLPPDRDLTRELTTPKWKLVSNGIIVEPKDDIKRRIGVSTDLADSVVMVCYDGALSRGLLGT